MGDLPGARTSARRGLEMARRLGAGVEKEVASLVAVWPLSKPSWGIWALLERCTKNHCRFNWGSLGPSHPDIASCYHNLGYLAARLRDWPLAEASYQKALAIKREVIPERFSSIGSSAGGLETQCFTWDVSQKPRSSWRKPCN